MPLFKKKYEVEFARETGDTLFKLVTSTSTVDASCRVSLSVLLLDVRIPLVTGLPAEPPAMCTVATSPETETAETMIWWTSRYHHLVRQYE